MGDPSDAPAPPGFRLCVKARELPSWRAGGVNVQRVSAASELGGHVEKQAREEGCGGVTAAQAS